MMLSVNDAFWVRVPNLLVGNGTVAQVGDLACQYGAKKVLVVTDQGIVKAGLAERVTASIEKAGLQYAVFADCEPNGLITAIEKCATMAKDGSYNFIVSVGGGSVMDTAKIAALAATGEEVSIEAIRELFAGVTRQPLPMINIPTTAGTGSEVSMGAIVTDDAGDNIKRAIWSPLMLPVTAVVDSTMTTHMPQTITAHTGWDVLAHAIEGYLNIKSNIVGDMFAERAIALVAENLRDAYAKGTVNEAARYNMSIAASLAITAVFINGGSIVNHGLGHSLQKVVHCTHGHSCAAMLPAILEFILPPCTGKLARVAALMGENVDGMTQREAALKGIAAIRQLAEDIRIPLHLQDMGVKKEDFSTVVDILFSVNSRMVTNTPMDLSPDDVMAILEASW
jgi:alcohol dehydrogenase class IV